MFFIYFLLFPTIAIDLKALLVLVQHADFLSLFFFLLFKLVHFPDDFFVEVLFCENFVDMIRSKVIPEELIVNSSTHEDDSDLGMQPDESFDGEKNEICVNVSFVNLIEDNEGVLFENLRAMDHPLKKYTICHKNYFI